MKFDDAGRVQCLAIRSLGVRQANMSTNLKLRGRTEDTWTCTKTKRTKRNKQTNVPTNLNLRGHIGVTLTIISISLFVLSRQTFGVSIEGICTCTVSVKIKLSLLVEFDPINNQSCNNMLHPFHLPKHWEHLQIRVAIREPFKNV